MPGVLVERNDAVAVYRAAGEAVARARRGEGPTPDRSQDRPLSRPLQGDPETYRPRDEAKTLRSADPIHALGTSLRASGLLDDAAEAALRQSVSDRIEAAYAFGRNSPYPAPAEALQHVFVQ